MSNRLAATSSSVVRCENKMDRQSLHVVFASVNGHAQAAIVITAIAIKATAMQHVHQNRP